MRQGRGKDGLVNVLGIILGISAASHDIRLIFVATFAALGAESISMAAVAYTSTNARRRLYLKELERENSRLKTLVADKELDIQILKKAIEIESKNS